MTHFTSVPVHDSFLSSDEVCFIKCKIYFEILNQNYELKHQKYIIQKKILSFQLLRPNYWALRMNIFYISQVESKD